MAEPEPCEICEYDRDECNCWEWGDEANCPDCHGTGQRIPIHCCDCGGMPYCHCKDTGTEPITVQLHDGTAKVIE
jgi:hypothetical protein